jgi:pimeloyl-ACP methyl ester carboxylesterase
MPDLQINDLCLHYELAGSADRNCPAVVFLHGLGSSGADWALQVPVFAERHRVIAPDLRAHGQTRGPDQPFTIETMADDLAELLAHLHEPPAHVVGLSLGGCAAQALALRHPQRVRTLTLVNTFAKYRPSSFQARLRAIVRWWLFLFMPMWATAAFVARGLFPRPEQQPYYQAAVASLNRNPKPAYYASVRAALAFDSRAQLPAVRCPTLVVVGERDTTVPLASKEALHRAIPGAQLLVVHDSGHATPYDQTEVFNRAVLEFTAAH